MDVPPSPITPAVQEAWERHIEQALATPEGPSVRTLMGLADARGEADQLECFRALGAQFGRPKVQRAWAEWTAVTDREELRLRLEVLRHVEALDPSLHPFLQFFFRASDPVLYQTAARVLGTHLNASEELWTYLQDFAGRQSVHLDSPISLNGERTRRRFVIALAASRACGAEDVPVLATDDPAAYLDGPALDLNAVLVATHILLEGSRPDATWATFGRRLLRDLGDHPVTASADPGLLRSSGRLLTALGAPPDTTAALWARLLQRAATPPEEPPEDQFPAHLQRLTRIDELVHSAVLGAEEQRIAVQQSLADVSDARLQHFLGYRWRLWAERERTLPPRNLPTPEGAGPSAVLARLLRAERGRADETTQARDDRRLAVFAELLDAMGEKRTWLRRPTEQRALIAFSVLDWSRYLPLPAPAVEATFSHHSFPRLSSKAEPSRETEGLRGQASPATFRILLRLSEWEGTGTEQLVGTRLLHQITDSYVLMMLLPSQRASELTASLADALEHLCRLSLRTRPDFRPAQFLYETSIRDPHPQFYDHLYSLCEGRTYPDVQGREVTLTPIVGRLRAEAQAVRPQSGALSARLDDAPWPGNPAFADGLRHVRRTLTAVQRDSGLVEGLRQLVDVFDPKSKDPATGARRLFGVLGATGTAAGPLVYRGRSGEKVLTYPDLRHALQEHAVALREALTSLQPDTLDEAHDIRDEALDIEDALDAIEDYLVPVIGIVEGTLLKDTLRHLRAQLQSWTDALTALHAQWRAAKRQQDAPAEIADHLFEEVLSHRDGPMRRRLLMVLAQTLVGEPSRGLGGRDAVDAWNRDQRLLDWALSGDQLDRLSSAEREAWTDVFAGRWRGLLEAAMEAGYEARVLWLATYDRFLPFRQQAPAAKLLAEVRSWFFDRYHLPAARQVTAALVSRPTLETFVGASAAFLMHFSRVWLALLLGAILMLDFGDAWTTMAAEGEVRSVAITFVVGVMGTFGYLFVDLRSKVQRAPEEKVWRVRRSRWGRLLGFLGLCLGITGGITTLLWVLLSGTGAVVQGVGAPLHIVVWTGFALFVGVFFGLIAETA